MRFKLMPSENKINIDGVAIVFAPSELSSLGIDEHIMAVEYNSDLKKGHIEWVDNWRTGKQPANTKFTEEMFSPYFPTSQMQACQDLHAKKKAAQEDTQ